MGRKGAAHGKAVFGPDSPLPTGLPRKDRNRVVPDLLSSLVQNPRRSVDRQHPGATEAQAMCMCTQPQGSLGRQACGEGALLPSLPDTFPRVLEALWERLGWQCPGLRGPYVQGPDVGWLGDQSHSPRVDTQRQARPTDDCSVFLHELTYSFQQPRELDVIIVPISQQGN